MSEVKHTSGPWSVPHFARPEVGCRCEYVLAGDRMGAVCSVHASGPSDGSYSNGDNPPFEEAVANAHLISAAPDLLAALKLARPFMAATIENVGFAFNEEALADARTDLALVDAAIGKAEGHSS